ncbi:MAG TPA: M36 family metallopeptidase [Thermoleophilaceae bacterium]|nr:M36 family metallopeptidase [Thermoleophilaceae bacterium]
MSKRARRARRLALAALAVCVCAGPARAADPERDSFEAAEDSTAEVPAQVDDARDDLKEDLGSQGLLTVDDASGAVRFLAQLDGFLDSTPSDDPAGAARDYLTDQAEVFGVEPSDIDDLELAERERSDGMQSLEFTQSVDGVPIIDTSLEAHLDDDGRLLAITGGLVPDAALDSTEPEVPQEEALEAAADEVAEPGDAYDGRLVAYTSGDELRLAWRVMVHASSTAVYDTLVDATTGEVVRRTNLVKFAGDALVFDDYPGGGIAALQSLTPYLSETDRLIGPNAHAFVDPDDVVPGTGPTPVLEPPPGEETPPSIGTDFIYPFGEYITIEYACDPTFRCSWDPKTAGDWTSDGHQAATQLFWHVNVFHDHLEDTPEIAFDDASGNFEDEDPVIAQAQDGANTNGGFPDLDHSNNANILVPPDGEPALMQMYLWDPIADLDPDTVPNYRPVHGGDDPSLVFHEYAHGLTGRLVTDAQGYGALNGAQAGAIDEGTADWYALDYLVDEGLTGDAESTPDVTLAPYEVDGPTGLRTQPIDCPAGSGGSACPSAGGSAGAGGYVYGDFAKIRGGAEVHDDGEIWAQTIWQLRRELIAVHGQTDGTARARRLVTDGLRLVPSNPSFLDMRNAILLADVQAVGGDRALIWEVFRSRGMGYAASTRDTDDVAPVQDFTGPPGVSTPVGSVAGTVRDLDTGAALVGARVAFAGHDSGLGEDLSTQTAANGTYRIDDVPARTWDFVTVTPVAGYDRSVTEDVTIAANQTAARNFALRRNWALASGGALVSSFTGFDYGYLGCGPSSAIDGTRRSVWSTRSPTNSDEPGQKRIVIQLPQPITLGEVRIDPSPGCGDPASAALREFRLEASANGSSYTTVAAGSFTSAHLGKTTAVTLNAKPTGVRFVRLWARSTQGTSPYIDVAEVQVFAPTAVAAPPATAPAPPAPPVPTEPARLRFITKKAKLGKRRYFAWRLAGPKGALVNARFTVRVRRGSTVRRITLARARFRLGKSTGTARVRIRVSRRTLRRLHARKKLRVAVTARGAGQRRSSTFSLRRVKVTRRR